jgi:NH3-dependent NAD+ synthetase
LRKLVNVVGVVGGVEDAVVVMIKTREVKEEKEKEKGMSIAPYYNTPSCYLELNNDDNKSKKSTSEKLPCY